MRGKWIAAAVTGAGVAYVAQRARRGTPELAAAPPRPVLPTPATAPAATPVTAPETAVTSPSVDESSAVVLDPAPVVVPAVVPVPTVVRTPAPERVVASTPAAEPIVLPEPEPEPEPAVVPEPQPTAEPRPDTAALPVVPPLAESSWEPEPQRRPAPEPVPEPAPEPVRAPAATEVGAFAARPGDDLDELDDEEVDPRERRRTVVALAGFYTGLVCVLVAPVLYGILTRWFFDYETAAELFPFVLVLLAVPAILAALPRTRRFGLYMLLGIAVTAVVVVGVGAAVVWLLLSTDVF